MEIICGRDVGIVPGREFALRGGVGFEDAVGLVPELGLTGELGDGLGAVPLGLNCWVGGFACREGSFGIDGFMLCGEGALGVGALGV